MQITKNLSNANGKIFESYGYYKVVVVNGVGLEKKFK